MITVVMSTYVSEGVGQIRAEYAAQVVAALVKNLVAPEPLRLHVADDSLHGDPWVHPLMDLAETGWGTESGYSNSGHHGIGASLNRALEALESDLWLYVTDDWVLAEPLDLGRAVKLLRDFDYGLVRLGPIHPNVRCETRFHEGVGYWLELDTKAGGFVFATRPFIAHRRFIDTIGPFSEGVNAYEAEQDYAERVCQGSNPKIAYDGGLTLNGPWRHIGEYEVGTIKP